MNSRIYGRATVNAVSRSRSMAQDVSAALLGGESDGHDDDDDEQDEADDKDEDNEVALEELHSRARARTHVR